MTYKQASAIRTTIEALSSAFDKNYSAACLPMSPEKEDDDTWEVHIYNNEQSELDYLRIHTLCQGFQEMLSIPYFYSSYNIGTSEKHRVKSFRLW